MCDPGTIALIAGGLGLIGGSKGPPAAKIPALDTQDAKEETGAEIILGGDRASDENDLLKTKTPNVSSKKTSASGLNVSKAKTGVSIL